MFYRHPTYTNYSVSMDGKVINNKSNKLLTPIRHSAGYTYYCLGRDVRIYTHRLLAEMFISNPDDKPCVNHINGIKNDNRLENLEWCTHKENMLHGWDIGQFNKSIGENNAISKLTYAQVTEIRAKYRPYKYSQQKLADEYGVSRGAIQQVVENRSWVR